MLFRRLARGDMAAIVDIQLGRLRKLLEERKIRLKLDEAAQEWLAEAGYDPVYGARPLKRVIQRNLQDRLAELLLEGSWRTGHDHGHGRRRRTENQHLEGASMAA